MSFPEGLPADYAARAAAVNLRHEDVAEHFILGSGHGGQNRNKRSTAVQLVHHPTGTEIRCFHRRKQHENRIGAWVLLLEHLESARTDIEKELKHRAYLEELQTHGKPPAVKAQNLKEKKKHGEAKERRKKI